MLQRYWQRSGFENNNACFLSIYSEHTILSQHRWMSLTSLSTAFLSYPADGTMIMKGYVQQNPVYDMKNSAYRISTEPTPLLSS